MLRTLCIPASTRGDIETYYLAYVVLVIVINPESTAGRPAFDVQYLPLCRY